MWEGLKYINSSKESAMWESVKSMSTGKQVARDLGFIQRVAEEQGYVTEKFALGLTLSLEGREYYAHHYEVEAYESNHGETWLKVVMAPISQVDPGSRLLAYSLRSRSDVVKFCQMLISVNEVKAMR